MVIHQPLTPEAFLAYAEQHADRRFDFMDGELVEVSPKRLHGRIQTILAAALEAYTQVNPVGVVHTEVLHILDSEWFIPDISVNKAVEAEYFTTPPLLAVEIRSDSQSRASQRRKARAYIRHGTPMVVLIFPGESVEIHRPGRKTQVLTAATDVLDGAPMLPGFQFSVQKLLSG